MISAQQKILRLAQAESARRKAEKEAESARKKAEQSDESSDSDVKRQAARDPRRRPATKSKGRGAASSGRNRERDSLSPLRNDELELLRHHGLLSSSSSSGSSSSSSSQRSKGKVLQLHSSCCVSVCQELFCFGDMEECVSITFIGTDDNRQSGKPLRRRVLVERHQRLARLSMAVNALNPSVQRKLEPSQYIVRGVLGRAHMHRRLQSRHGRQESKARHPTRCDGIAAA